MPSGSCFCGNVQISFTGEPTALALCHCLNCRKISGSTFSNNLVVPEANFKVEKGEPKGIPKTGDSSRKATNYFCGDCGCHLFGLAEWNPGKVVIRAGCLDDLEWPDKNVPKAELFIERRVAWIEPIPEAAQITGMGV